MIAVRSKMLNSVEKSQVEAVRCCWWEIELSMRWRVERQSQRTFRYPRIIQNLVHGVADGRRFVLIANRAVTFWQDAIDCEVCRRLAGTVGHLEAFFAACMTTTTEAMKISELSSRQSLLIQQLWETTTKRALIQKRDWTWWVDESDWRCGDYVSEKVSTVATTKKTRQPMVGLQNVDRGLSQQPALEEQAKSELYARTTPKLTFSTKQWGHLYDNWLKIRITREREFVIAEKRNQTPKKTAKPQLIKRFTVLRRLGFS